MGYPILVTGCLCLLGLAGAKAQPADTLTVHFAFGKYTLPSEDQAALDRRYAAFGPRILSVAFTGYCDSIGNDRYNDTLSRQRIDAVKKYLHAKGLADTLFRTEIAYGRRMPLNDNGDEQKRSLNRRVSVIFRLRPPTLTALREALRDTAAAVGKTFVLENVLFYGDMHRPIPVSFRVLLDLLAFMKQHPGLRFEIQGYVCCVPEEADGYDIESHAADLSVQRAKYVYLFLKGNGVDSTRISYKGFGARNKIFPMERNDEEMKRNRRVEIKVLGW